MKKKYNALFGHEGAWYAKKGDAHDPVHSLPPGVYEVSIHESMAGTFTVFDPVKNTSDELVDLPSKEYSRVMQETKTFLKPETKARFKDLGFLYKRSTILHGLPGTGKTCLVSRVSREVVSMGGVVLLPYKVGCISAAFSVLKDLQPDCLTVVILEEFDDIVAGSGESKLLDLLDGHSQKENVMFLATTNYIDRIPARIMRPGRFASVIEVDFPTSEARLSYLNAKLRDVLPTKTISKWVELSAGLSIDELKECIQSVILLGNTIEHVIERISKTRSITKTSSRDSSAATLTMSELKSLTYKSMSK